MSKILKVLFGDPNKKLLGELDKDVVKINALEASVQGLTDEELKAKTSEFKQRLSEGAVLDDLVHEAFAVVREAAKRTLGQRHYDVQLIGGLVMHRGQIAEMRTGEGKTLTATLALYTNALRGQGCHLVTVNDYLARRDAVWMGQVFDFLGMSVSCIQQDGGLIYDPSFRHEEGSTEEARADKERDQKGSFAVREDYLRPCDRKTAYDADITYGTNNQFGFDYLRDNMAPTLDQCVMRELHYAIIDEIDSILIDEARTPLIISAPAEKSNDLYVRFAQIATTLKEQEDFNIDEKMRASTLTEAGIEKIERALGIENLYAIDQGIYQRFADTALRARANYQRDVHYVVKDGEVLIVDEFTGRLMQGRRFSEGIHQAIEAKEGVEIKNESRTMATITFQNLFRMYHKLSGMTGTAATEAEEFGKIYNLEVVEIPTNKPIARVDAQDRVYKTEAGKFLALARDVKAYQEKGQPVLIGTVSVDKNEILSQLFTKSGIRHEVLNAKNHTREGEIIAQAGRKGSVTIATNMAGRGVDIKLGGNPSTKEEETEVVAFGGLHVIGTERHDSRRIDNQLRGRSGRQGDPGYTQFYLSMEDGLMRIFGSDRAKGMMDRLGIPEDQAIEAKMISSSIEKAQTRVEGHHFDSRKHLLEYDDVLNKHREIIYARRREVLETFAHEPEKLRDRILDIIEGEVEQIVLFHSSEMGPAGSWDVKEIVESVHTIVALSDQQKAELSQIGHEATKDKEELAQGRSEVIGTIMDLIRTQYDSLYDVFEDKKSVYAIERGVLLRAIDMLWIDHLASMTALRTGIGLQGYGQRDPLVEYKKEGYNIFHQLLGSINTEITQTFFKYAKHAVDMKVQVELGKSVFQRAGVTLQGAKKTSDNGLERTVSEEPKVGRNEPCPCGSGKKYKKCHGV
ncbi:preprotein translocase subunit SecA [Candidatus Uhrbacteria bacterium CG10_big_fil_rev_8_21_14_0_10_48_16]|uniref:Protein translocase subunit SecA n=1 Tax=Candidatus Uhrbacteria bacterium CG10_big_fil_rev_8_21_14_0_10_48_16 TaxID=1975038 RepID=A0A2M8LGD9_9BACT|nr:MAG: preprotein translocase subunit SecA [Candidatus Uhrbacteria bacterium CG10_big_fil_rev_8_21_14_0_10_48_16]